MNRPLFPHLCLILWGATSFLRAEDGRLLSLIVPPGEGDRFQQAEFSCWIPDAPGPLKRVIIHQHGCTNASPDQHPPVTGDWHWRALARKHHAALLVPMYRVDGSCDEWNDPESGSERALFTALTDFAGRSGRTELEDAPWVLWGHSGGSSWSAQMIVRHPQRVLAASFRGGCHKQFGDAAFRAKFIPLARDLPLLLVWGKRESVAPSRHLVSWEPMNTLFRELRSCGGKVCRVIDPRSEHGCDDSRLMSLSFFDAVLSGEAVPGMLADLVSLTNREFNPVTRADPTLAWMPNPGFAERWHEFSETGTLRPVEPPRTAPELTLTRDARGHALLTWRIVPEIGGGLRVVRIRRDGELWREFALQPTDCLATSRDSTPEILRTDRLTDESDPSHTYQITFLDASGNESPPGLATERGGR